MPTRFERFPAERVFVGLLAALVMFTWGCFTPTSGSIASDRRDTESLRDVGIQARCHPYFPNQAGWYGGDAAFSVVLPDRNTSLWLFGDTFVDQSAEIDGREFPFVHNSIGVSRCAEDGQFGLDTYWRRGKSLKPSAFFVPDPTAAWVERIHQETGHAPYFWLFDGFVLDGTLYVGLLRIAHSEPRGPFHLPFRIVGMDLARIENPSASPEHWQVLVSTVSEQEGAFPGAGFVLDGDFLYAFAALEHEDGERPRALTRVNLRDLETYRPDLSGAVETYQTDGQWRRGFRPKRARILMGDSATEMSVHFDPAARRWIAVYLSPGSAASDDGATSIRIRTARRLEGPWSPPRPLVSIPETTPRVGHPVDENLFCYAAKAHPQFSKPGHLLVTYVCNLFARTEEEVSPILERLRTSPELYRPRALEVAIPEDLIGSPP